MEKKTRVIIHQDVYICAMLASVALYFYSLLNTMLYEATRFPRIMLVAFLIFVALIFLDGVRKSITATRTGNTTGTKFITLQSIASPMGVFSITCLYVYLIITIGFFPATAVFTPGLALFFKYTNITALICMTLGSIAFVYLIFVRVLGATLP